jgi:hypothetical protein
MMRNLDKFTELGGRVGDTVANFGRDLFNLSKELVELVKDTVKDESPKGN